MPMCVCRCCLCVRCGRPVGCCADLSFGGPSMVIPCSFWNGLPLATDHVSQGGAKMAACTLPVCIWCLQNSMVAGCDRSLCGVWLLERSMDIGRML